MMLDFISQVGWNEGKCYFQQDGARAHIKNTTIDFLGPSFRKRLIYLNSVSDVEWPPRSPDLSPLNFFCGHTLKIESTRPLHRIFPIWRPRLKKKFKKLASELRKMFFRIYQSVLMVVLSKKVIISNILCKIVVFSCK